MATSFGALCTDFYINQKLALKMDLPGERETILHLFDRVRKSIPSMERFHRYQNELALESARTDSEYRWLALRRSSVRTGHVNPQTMAEAYKFHRLILEVAPYHLTISPLDVDYLELLFGFDLECKGNHDEVVYEALFSGTPVGDLVKVGGNSDVRMLDVQPIFGIQLNDRGDLQAYFEVKTRNRGRRGSGDRFSEQPISLFLTVRKYGPVRTLEELMELSEVLRQHAESLASDRLVPDLLTPISRHITSSNA